MIGNPVDETDRLYRFLFTGVRKKETGHLRQRETHLKCIPNTRDSPDRMTHQMTHLQDSNICMYNSATGTLTLQRQRTYEAKIAVLRVAEDAERC